MKPRHVTLVHFIDVNIPIYAVGPEDRHKQQSLRILSMALNNRSAFVTDSEALQEIIHYYVAARRWPEGRAALNQFVETMQGRIEPVYAEDVILAGQMIDRYPGASSRDLIHTAVMRRLSITRVISADTDFDSIDGIERLDPALLDQWEHSILDN